MKLIKLIDSDGTIVECQADDYVDVMVLMDGRVFKRRGAGDNFYRDTNHVSEDRAKVAMMTGAIIVAAAARDGWSLVRALKEMLVRHDGPPQLLEIVGTMTGDTRAWVMAHVSVLPGEANGPGYRIGVNDPTLPCGQCKAPIDPAELALMPLQVDGSQARRVSRFAECACGNRIHLMTREGWERWYATSEKPKGVLYWQPAPDHREFYLRLGRAVDDAS